MDAKIESGVWARSAWGKELDRFQKQKGKRCGRMIGSDNAQIRIEAEVFDASTTIGQQKRPMIT